MICVLAYVIFFCCIFEDTDTATRRPTSKVRSHSRANNKAFPLKIGINFILIVKSLCITNICCTFAGAKSNEQIKRPFLNKPFLSRG